MILGRLFVALITVINSKVIPWFVPGSSRRLAFAGFPDAYIGIRVRQLNADINAKNIAACLLNMT